MCGAPTPRRRARRRTKSHEGTKTRRRPLPRQATKARRHEEKRARRDFSVDPALAGLLAAAKNRIDHRCAWLSRAELQEIQNRPTALVVRGVFEHAGATSGPRKRDLEYLADGRGRTIGHEDQPVC